MQTASNTQSGAKNPVDVAIYDGAGNQITSFGGGSGGTAHTDDAAFSIGSAASVTPVGYLADEAASDAVDEGDMGAARMTLSRKALGVISDPGTNSVHANVLDLTTNNAVAVAIVDTNGDQIASFGGGTQYTEDAAAAANPVGTALNLVRLDTPVALVSADGDNVTLRGSNFGAAYVTLVGSSGLKIDSDGSSLLVGSPNGALALEDGGNLDTIAAAVRAEDVASANADPGVVLLAVRQDTPANTSGTDGDFETPKMSAGRLWTSAIITAVPADPFGANADAASATGSISAKLRFIAATGIPITGTVTVGSHAVTNAGTFVVQENGAALTSLQLIDDIVLVDDAAFTPGTSKVAMAGFQADESSTDSVDEGDAGAARMTLDRKVIVTMQPHTTGGWTTFMASSGDGSTALTSTVQAVKASAGKLGGWYIYNPNAAATYVIIYNVASGSVTVGTTNPQIVLCIPPTSAANIEFANGITFDTAIAVAATTTGGGSTAPATALEANFFYK